MGLVQSGAVSAYFEWPPGVLLQIQCPSLTAFLRSEIGGIYRGAERPGAPDARIVFCGRPDEVPASAEVLRGRYKGLAWQLASRPAADGKTSYFFYAPFFSVFLFVRVCLLPVLKKITVEKGGFLLIGSAFAHQGTAFVISGSPGSGKTRLLLKALEAGGVLLGDSEVMLTADRRILPVFSYMEARRGTLRGTAFWAKLRTGQKVYLWLCELLSKVSLKAISFNLRFHPAESRQTAQGAPSQAFSHYVVIYLKKGSDKILALSARDFAAEVNGYETNYQRLFGSSIYTEALRSQGLKQLEQLLSEASLHQMPSAEKAYDFLQKEMKL